MSQTENLLRYMKSRPIDPATAVQVFRCYRLAARILELRDRGYNIITTMKKANGKVFAEYSLK
jgi:hypothetical protein